MKIVLIVLACIFGMLCSIYALDEVKLEEASMIEASGSSPIDRAGIQGTILAHIHSKMAPITDNYYIDGIEVDFDYIHEAIVKDEEYYISAATFTAGEDVYEISFYVRDISGLYVVEKEILNKKNKNIMSKVLWKTALTENRAPAKIE